MALDSQTIWVSVVLMDELVCAACGQRLKAKGAFWAYNGEFQVEVGPDCHQRIVAAGAVGVASIFADLRLYDVKYDPEEEHPEPLEEIQRLRDQIAELEARLAVDAQHNDNQAKQIKELRTARDAYRNEITILREQLATEQKIRNTILREQLATEKKISKATMRDQRTLIDKLQAEVRELKAKATRQEGFTDELAGDFEDKLNDIADLNDQVKRLRAQLREARAQIKELTPPPDAWEDDIRAYLAQWEGERIPTTELLQVVGATEDDIAATMRLGRVMQAIGGYKRSNNVRLTNGRIVRGYIPIKDWEA